MYIRVERLKKLLRRNGMAPTQFADKINVEAEEVFCMLEGKSVGVYTSRQFINYLKADYAQYYIDWERLGIANPLKKEQQNIMRGYHDQQFRSQVHYTTV